MTHGITDEEIEKIKSGHAGGHHAPIYMMGESTRVGPSPRWIAYIDELRIEIEALRARLSQAGAGGGVVVKPLEWRLDDENPFGGEVADAGGFRYVVIGNEWWRRPYGVATKASSPSPKAAAQADYEARILAALRSDGGKDG